MLLLVAALLQDLPSRALPAHPHKTTQIRLSPDGKLALTLGEPDRVVKVWRLDTGKVLHTLGDRATSFALRPDGGLVAVGGEVDTAVWNLVTGETTRRLDAPRVIALGWSRDGAALTTVSIQRGGNKPGGLVAAIEGRKPVFIPLARDPAWAAVSPDGLHVAVPHDGQVRVWDVANDKVAYEVAGRTAAFSPDGKTLATAGDKVVRLWEGAKEVRTLEAVYDNSPCLEFAGDVLLVGADAGIELWEGGRRRPVTYAGPGTGLFFPASLALSADGRTLAAGGALILKNAPASGRVTGPLHFWKVR
ncbi:MAG TPA: hypothetical protein VF950_02535 [Planctomycetota bacterium]